MNSVVDAWEPFFTAQLGAAAALGGLVFVGLSLNLKKILSAPSLPNRALLALALLVVILILSSLMLMPGLSLTVVGSLTLALGFVTTVAGTMVQLRALRRTKYNSRANVIANLLLFECSVLPYVIGGWLFLRGDLDALYWIATAIIVSFAKAVLDAWVLLVEINR